MSARWRWRRAAVAATVATLATLALTACGRAPDRSGRTRAEPRPIRVQPEGADRRRVWHAAGETVIPAHPGCVAALGFDDEVLALGVTPCAFLTTFGVVRPYAAAALARARPISPLYGESEPPFEALLAARPDLILASGVTTGRMEALWAIAPTVIFDDAPGGERRRLGEVAAVLGVPERAPRILADYDAQLAEARRLIEARIGRQRVAVIRVRARKYNLISASLAGPVLYDDLGLEPPALVRARLTGGGDRRADLAVLDPEELADLDADHLFVILNPQLQSDRHAAALEEIPLWRRVPAVARGHVYYVSQTNWLARGLIVRSVIVDEVVAALGSEGRFGEPADSPAARRQQIARVVRDPSPVGRGHALIPSRWAAEVEAMPSAAESVTGSGERGDGTR